MIHGSIDQRISTFARTNVFIANFSRKGAEEERAGEFVGKKLENVTDLMCSTDVKDKRDDVVEMY